MQQNERLSAYMDGQETESVLAESLASSPELQQKWASYHTIRNVMQGEEILLGNDFSAKMATLIENEEIEATDNAEEMQKPRGLLLKLKRWSTPIMQAGIAASVCLVAVLGANMFNSHQEVAQNESVLQTLPFSNAVQAVSYNAPLKDLATTERLEQQQRRVDMLLQNQELQYRTTPENVGIQNKEEKAKAQTSSTTHSDVISK